MAGEQSWRAHHEARKRSDLNQREYCEAEGIPLKGLCNWRAQCKAERQPAPPRLLYRRGGLSHTLSHSLSHDEGGGVATDRPGGKRRPSADIQRRGQAPDSGAGGAAGCEPIRRWRRATG